MKILIIGILSFLGWSTLSTYIYVCKIKGLCDNPVTIQMNDAGEENTIAIDTVQKSIMPNKITVPKDLIIYFAFDEAEFNANSITGNYIDESNAYLYQNKHASFTITGHTDAIGTRDYNQALGYRRAQNLQHYFESKGVNGNKITIFSEGENEPADNNNTNMGRAHNRRTVITIK